MLFYTPMRYIEKEIFRAGTFTDMNGVETSWTTNDLDNIVNHYNNVSENDLAPIVLGHPKTDSPAYGWLLKAWRSGEKLFGLMRTNESAEIADYIEQGKYKNVSLSITNKTHINHVGFLGGARPAVPDLANPKLYGKEKEGSVYNIENSTFAQGNKMEEKIAEMQTAIANQATKIAGIETAITEIKDAISAIAGTEKKTPPAGEIPAKFAQEIEQLSQQNNQLAYDNFAAFLDSEEVTSRITSAVKNTCIEKAKKVLESKANFANSEVIAGMKEMILAFPKTSPITMQFSQFANGNSAVGTTEKTDPVKRYKERNGIS